MRGPAQFITSMAFVLLTFATLAVTNDDRHKAGIEVLRNLLTSAYNQMGRLPGTCPRPAYYRKALEGIVSWLDDLQHGRVSTKLARRCLCELWPGDPLGTYKGQEKFALATKLSGEYTNIFNGYTGVHSSADISQRKEILTEEFGRAIVSNREQLALHAGGYDWDLGKIERGLLWDDARKRNTLLRPTHSARTRHKKYLNNEKALATKIHNDLIDGLNNCALQIQQGTRGSADLDPNIIRVLTGLRDYLQLPDRDRLNFGAWALRSLFLNVPLGSNTRSSTPSPSLLGAQFDYGNSKHTEPTEKPSKNPVATSNLASEDNPQSPACDLDMELDWPTEEPPENPVAPSQLDSADDLLDPGHNLEMESPWLTEEPSKNPVPLFQLASAGDTLDPAHNLKNLIPWPTSDIPWEDDEDDEGSLESDGENMEIELARRSYGAVV